MSRTRPVDPSRREQVAASNHRFGLALSGVGAVLLPLGVVLITLGVATAAQVRRTGEELGAGESVT